MIRFDPPFSSTGAALSADEIGRLDALLDALDNDDAMVVEELDGFIAGLACTPEPVGSAQLLSYALGEAGADDADAVPGGAADAAPVAAPAAAATAALVDAHPELAALITRHAASVVGAFDRGEYSPVLAYDEQGHADGSAWAVGFLQAVELFPDSWDALVDEKDFSDALSAIEALAATLDDGARPLSRRERDSLIDGMIGDAADIHEFFRPYRLSGTTPAEMRVETVRRVQPKVGRNDPCPCGSGRKYKLCCGVNG
ncbi:MAG: UPF0149 family protein [Burkholderiaceae bacterium]